MDEKEVYNNPRIAGKTTIALQDFFFKGRQGKAIVYKTPEGTFYSPKAMEQQLQKQREEFREFLVNVLPGGDALRAMCPNTGDTGLAILDALKEFRESALVLFDKIFGSKY